MGGEMGELMGDRVQGKRMTWSGRFRGRLRLRSEGTRAQQFIAAANQHMRNMGTTARAKAAALPVIMFIIGPRETHNYRERCL